jgi:hypothetical protein
MGRHLPLQATLQLLFDRITDNYAVAKLQGFDY